MHSNGDAGTPRHLGRSCCSVTFHRRAAGSRGGLVNTGVWCGRVCTGRSQTTSLWKGRCKPRRFPVGATRHGGGGWHTCLRAPNLWGPHAGSTQAEPGRAGGTASRNGNVHRATLLLLHPSHSTLNARSPGRGAGLSARDLQHDPPPFSGQREATGPGWGQARGRARIQCRGFLLSCGHLPLMAPDTGFHFPS